jgi:hypothetical protein
LHRIRLSGPNVALTVAAAVAAASLAWAPGAHAQSNSAIAEQLFLDGQKLMDAGKVPEACQKFSDSQRLDPALGTLMHLAACNEKAGKLATAWSEFSDAAAQAQKSGQGEREKFAREHAAALQGKLQKIVIDLPQPPEGVAIKLDDATLPSGVLGSEIPLDPGDHTLEITAPGKKPWKQAKLTIGQGAAVTHVPVTLEDDTSAPPPPTGAAGAAPATAAESPEGTDHPTKRLVGYILGGAGIVSLGVAVAEEVTSAGRNSDESKYPSGSSQRQTVSDQASQAQTYAIVFGAAGLVAIGAGVYLILTAHDSTPAAPATGKLTVTPLLGPSLAGAGLHFAW